MPTMTQTVMELASARDELEYQTQQVVTLEADIKSLEHEIELMRHRLNRRRQDAESALYRVQALERHLKAVTAAQVA